MNYTDWEQLSGSPAGTAVIIALTILAFIWFILWLFLPVIVYSIKQQLDRMLARQARMEELLRQAVRHKDPTIGKLVDD